MESVKWLHIANFYFTIYLFIYLLLFICLFLLYDLFPRLTA